jgi:uncharacterized protein (DUF2147 family)
MLAATAAIAADPSGTFVRPSTGTQINFYPCGGNLCGKIVAVKDPAKTQTVGTVILNGAKKTGDNKWQGELLNTDDGKTYSGHVTMVSANAVKLEGCALGGLVCKGETWTRVK